MSYLIRVLLKLLLIRMVSSWYRHDSHPVGRFDPTRHPNWAVLNNEDCGTSLTDRIIGGRNATMGQYPWIARIGYASKKRPRNRIVFKCGGTLINPCYVVTAAHCIAKIPPDLYVAGIRLGEHDEKTDIDCHQGHCADHVQDFFPEKILVHRKYGKPTFKHDISLIKLDRKIQLNQWVRPICLPHAGLLTKSFVGETAEVAGWGIFDLRYPKGSPVLQTVKVPVVELDRCIRDYESKLAIDEQQLCVGGTVGKDSCGGDSGGPLMKVDVADDYPRYYLIGVVSFGSKMCGETTTPAVYTRLSAYMSWILNNVRGCQ